jgi:hypothetical protein
MTRERRNSIGRRLKAIILGIIALSIPLRVVGADTSPQVELDTAKAGPRAIESLTERSVLNGYRFAWENLAHALESNSVAPLNGSFVGTANSWLVDRVTAQRRSGLRARYLNQHHKLDAVFYAPEGDVIELHDTAEYELQILDGDKTVHDDHVVVHYVVLMTPGSDRWVIRQMQAVPQF